MTDTVAGYRNLVAQVNIFVQAFESLKLMSDRIGADSALSGQFATAAQATQRADLTAADFDNFKVATDLVTTLLESVANDTTTNHVNTGGKAVLAFYKLI